MLRVLMFIVSLIFSFFVQATTVLSLNTEWFWDGQEPHEGQIAVGPSGIPPSKKQVELEAFVIAQIINHRKADIVGLVEVEGESVVKKIANYLIGDWNTVFLKGRDTVTGQDVALLTKFDVIADTMNSLKGIKGKYKNKEATPSKVLSVGLKDGSETYLVTVAHLISKRSSNDDKRAAQANAIAKYVNSKKTNYDHLIVLGDLNDTPSSEPIKQILSAGLNLISDSADYSYVYQGKKQLIDHILVSKSLSQNADFESFDMGPVSDHLGIFAKL